MKKVILGLLLGMFNVFMAQNIDLKAIKTNIEDEKSEFYYERLITRFQATPELMSDEEMKHLYYGKLFTKYYRISKDEDYKKSEKIMIGIYQKNNPEKSEIKEVLALGEKLLEKDPFDMRILLVYTNYSKNSIHKMQLRRLVNTILKSGKGNSKTTPICVVEIPDGYFIGDIQGKNFREYRRITRWVKDGAIDEYVKGKDRVFIKVLYDK